MKDRKFEKLIIDIIASSLEEKNLSESNSVYHYSISSNYRRGTRNYLEKLSDKKLLLIIKNFNHRKHSISGNSSTFMQSELIIQNFFEAVESSNYYKQYNYVKPNKSEKEIVESFTSKQIKSLSSDIFYIASAIYLDRRKQNISFFKKIICSGSEILFYSLFRGNNAHLLGVWGSTRHLIVKDKNVQRAIYERLLTTKCNPIKTLCAELLITPEYIVDVYNKVNLTDYSKKKLGSNMSYWVEDNIHSIIDDNFPIDYLLFCKEQIGRNWWSNISVFNSNRLVDICMKLNRKKRLSAMIRMAELLSKSTFNGGYYSSGNPTGRYVKNAFSTLILTMDRKDLLIFMGYMQDGKNNSSCFPVNQLKEYLFSHLV